VSGDKVTLYCSDVGVERDIFFEPSTAFSYIREKSPNKIIYEVEEEQPLNFNSILIGRYWRFEKGKRIWERVFLFEQSRGKNPALESEGVMVKFSRNLSKVRVWHWYIEIPFNRSEGVLLVPHLKNLTLLRDYLALELYVTTIFPRNDTWWPLHSIGPLSFNKSLDELVYFQSIDNETILAKIKIPSNKEIKGITLGYEGQPKILSQHGNFCIVKLRFGFNKKPVFYVLLPSNYEIKKVSIEGFPLSFSNCPYSIESDYSCYVVKTNFTVISTYDLIMEIYKKSSE